MYDIHSHILPNIDDGPHEMDDSVAMARVAQNDGTIKMICTPHHKDVTENHSISKLKQLFSEFKSRLKTENINLEIALGMENHISLDLPEALSNGTSLTLNQTNYALIELPFFGKPNFIFFDAWCGGAKSISEEDWKPPMNDLEREEDPDGIWSKWSNQQLAGEYQELFSLFDFLPFMF